TPFFCSGCPHNSSTVADDDALVGAGIGCHTMILLNPEGRGTITGITQMGGEGAQWIGMAPFVGAGHEHFTQNLGDGTFHHSGSLAIRAAVASGNNMTYRILYNSTVAMTGGQDAVGQMDVAHMVDHLRSEGVARIIVTTDDVKAARKLGLPRSVAVWDRNRIAEAEQVLSRTPGVTVLIHEQECATELRRKRKRGTAPKPREAVVINERLCEGCGDCGEKSNCLSVHPTDTEFGRKTTIHQSSCNTDLTCLSGDCPAFMTVTPGKRGKASGPSIDSLERADVPAPAASVAGRDQNIRLMGVGGTGVVTTSQVLATAAVLAGRHVRTLDQTGLAQKGGAVVSDVKISHAPIQAGNKVSEGDCDLYLGYDLLVAARADNAAVLSPSGTAIVSTSIVPTGAMVTDRTVSFPAIADALAPLTAILRDGSLIELDSRRYAEALFGAEQFANMFLLGIAYQIGALNLPDLAIEEAITLNGVAVKPNLQAFRRGRQLVADPATLEQLVDDVIGAHEEPAVTPSAIVAAPAGSELERLVAVRRDELVAYQNEGYARRYEAQVEKARAAEAELGTDTRFSESVARHVYKFMAYKDEYEVARLALDTETREAITRDFGSDAKSAWRLHPPTLRAMGMKNKISLGGWFAPAFWMLYRLRVLRGTPLDPFGRAHVRKVERQLLAEYTEMIDTLCVQLSEATYDTATELAGLPDLVRGYEDVKLRSVTDYEARRTALLASLEDKVNGRAT
ncbi:MAG: Indolepyruvate ferredoxin oxidoreductase, partial [Aeromicrobium sp.]|nr:Indolepyruvate ferredoxin oxidoreductase [Aeromicrobium sp.]